MTARGQTLADRVGFVCGSKLHFDFLDFDVEIRDLLTQQDGHAFGLRRNVRLLFISAQQRTNLTNPLAGDHTELRGVAPQRVDQQGPLTD